MKQFQRRVRWLLILATVAVAYLMLAYVALPMLWSHHEREPGLASLPMVTRTGTGIPGDPLNVGLVGSEEDILRAMHAAGWFPADPVTLRTSIKIVGSVVLDRPYHDAPVSPLFYEGKKEQLASKSRLVGALIGDITFVCGGCFKRVRMIDRSGSEP